MTNQPATAPAAPAPLAIGTPAIRDQYGAPTMRGYLYETTAPDESGLASFTIGANGLQPTRARVSIVWDNGTTSESLADGIAAPWFEHAARVDMAPARPQEIEFLLEAARDKAARDDVARAKAKALETDERAQFLEKITPLIPDLAQAVIVAELVQDESDSMTDYFGSTTTRRVILGFSTHTRNLFPEMRKAAKNHPDTAHLANAPKDAEHRENYSMGGGMFLKMTGRHRDGWRVRKEPFYRKGDERAAEIRTGEISLDAPRATPAHATSTAPAALAGGVTVEEHTHTKKGFQMWIVCLADRVDRATYDALLTSARGAGGWYSRKWGNTPAGFAFKDKDAAHTFAAGIAGDATSTDTPTAPAAPAPDQGATMADKLETMADGMAGAIADKFRDRAQNTPKQRKQAASARQDGNDLERAQKGLRVLAGMWRAGTVPATLRKVTSKKAATDAARERFDYSGAGYYDVGRPTGEPANDTPTARAFWDIAGQKTPEEVTRDAIAAATLKIQNSTIPGFFPTPAAIVAQMLDRAGVEPGHTVLEPGAGAGAIVQAVQDAQPGAVVTALEVNGNLVDLLHLKGFSATQGDFMAESDLGTFDRVLMNPPFEKGQDVAHVRRAFDHLKPGGVLVSIMAPGWQFNGAGKFAAFREWLETLPHTVDAIGAGAFKESGTGVATVMVTIRKPLEG